MDVLAVNGSDFAVSGIVWASDLGARYVKSFFACGEGGSEKSQVSHIHDDVLASPGPTMRETLRFGHFCAYATSSLRILACESRCLHDLRVC